MKCPKVFGPVYSKWLVSMATTQKLGYQKINTLLDLSFLSCNIERHMRYQIVASHELYKMESQNQLFWLPGCHGKKRLFKICLHLKFASLSVTIATTIISVTLLVIITQFMVARNKITYDKYIAFNFKLDSKYYI